MATIPVARRRTPRFVAEFSSVGQAQEAARELEAEALAGVEVHLYAYREREPAQAAGDVPDRSRRGLTLAGGFLVGSVVMLGVGVVIAAWLPATSSTLLALLAALVVVGGGVGLVTGLLAVRANDHASADRPVARIEVTGPDADPLREARHIVESHAPEHLTAVRRFVGS